MKRFIKATIQVKYFEILELYYISKTIKPKKAAK